MATAAPTAKKPAAKKAAAPKAAAPDSDIEQCRRDFAGYRRGRRRDFRRSAARDSLGARNR
jgi:hypothetical protein